MVFYTNAKNKSNFMAPRLTAVQMLSLFIWLDFFGIICILDYFIFRNNTLPMTIPVFNNNFDIIIDFIFIQIILYFIFNKKKIMKLEDKYKDKEVFSKNNILTVVFAFVIPLVVAFTFIQLRIMNIYLW